MKPIALLLLLCLTSAFAEIADPDRSGYDLGRVEGATYAQENHHALNDIALSKVARDAAREIKIPKRQRAAWIAGWKRGFREEYYAAQDEAAPKPY